MQKVETIGLYRIIKCVFINYNWASGNNYRSHSIFFQIHSYFNHIIVKSNRERRSDDLLEFAELGLCAS